MQLETTRFGAIDVPENAVITFTQPILGFQEHRRFVLLPGPGHFLKWLQSTDSGELAFILMDPRSVVSDYAIKLTVHDLTELGASDATEIEVYTLVVVPRDPAKVRTNLKAPIVLNPKQRLAKQIVLENSDYPVQFYLVEAQKNTENQEVADARTNS